MAVGRIAGILQSKSRRYWLTAALVLAATVALTPWVNEHLNLNSLRYKFFQVMGTYAARQLESRYIKVVAVTNDDYIHDEPQGSSPINRHYLARIVDALRQANVQLIALDFNLHIKDPSVTAVSVGDFSHIVNKQQVDTLVRAVIEAADNDIKVVLPKNIAIEPYRLVPDIYQPYGICTKLVADGRWDNPGSAGFAISPKAARNIACGYIQLPYDERQVPPMLDVGEKGRIDSLSLAIARAKDPRAAAAVGTATKFVTYLPASETESIPAGKLLKADPDVLDTLRHNAVVVGGMWLSSDGLGLVDVHDAVTGPISGVLIHENFAEGILDGRQVAPLPEWVLIAVEIAAGIVFALLFAAVADAWIKLVLLVAISVILFAAQWLIFALFGTFFEAFLPLLGLSLHSIVEKLLE
ncbi:MAG: CHASE2 domain-containing protein [Alphaproteobacteria bacterium]|nr:CHASE2 domain-containing protein [Alphaproteobacteria bacterium]